MITLIFRSATLYCVLFVVLLPCAFGNRHGQNTRWVKPGALDRWGQQQKLHTETLQCDCPAPPEPPPPAPCSDDIIEDQRLALVFYRKLIKTLFARDTLHADPAAPDHYNVDLSLRISARQLDKLLDDSSSAREVNLIVSAILEKSTNSQRNFIFRENQCERLYSFLMQCLESKIIHNLLPIILLIAVCYTVRIVSRITRINSFIVFLLLILSITACNKWKECNENLAKKSLQNMEPATGWRAWIGFGSTKEGSWLPVCDPLQVFVELTVNVQALYFKSIFKELLGAFSESTKGAGIFQTIITGTFLLGFAYIVITSLLSVGIRSGFEMFGNMVTTGMRPSSNTPPIADGAANNIAQPQQLPAVNLNIHIGDSIARAVPLHEILRQESQRIEVVSEEAAAAIEDTRSRTQTNPAEPVPVLSASESAEQLNELNPKIAETQKNNEK